MEASAEYGIGLVYGCQQCREIHFVLFLADAGGLPEAKAKATLLVRGDVGVRCPSCNDVMTHLATGTNGGDDLLLALHETGSDSG